MGEKDSSGVIRLPCGLVVRQDRLLWGIILFALLVGLLAATHRNCAKPSLFGDENTYHKLALALVHHQPYFTTDKPPGYPAFVALVYAVVGPRPLALYFMQAVVFVLTLLLIYKVALAVSEDVKTALLTIALCALWIPFHIYVAKELSEILNGLIIALALWCVMAAAARPTLGKCAVAGITTGLSALVKPVALPYIGLAALLVFLMGENRRRRLIPAAVLVLVALATLAPWTARNYVVTGKIIPVTTTGGSALVLGADPTVCDYGVAPRWWQEILAKPEAERDRIFQEMGRSLVWEHPLRTAGLCVRKFGIFWFSLGWGARAFPQLPHIGGYAITKQSVVRLPLFILAVIGLFTLPAPARRRAYPMLGVLLVWTVTFVALYVERRFSLPVEFYEFFLASVALLHIHERLVKRQARPRLSGNDRQ